MNNVFGAPNSNW